MALPLELEGAEIGHGVARALVRRLPAQVSKQGGEMGKIALGPGIARQQGQIGGPRRRLEMGEGPGVDLLGQRAPQRMVRQPPRHPRPFPYLFENLYACILPAAPPY